MKKMLLISMLLISSISHAVLLEESDVLGRHLIVDQSQGQVQGIIKISKDTSEKRLGNLIVEMSLNVNGAEIKAECSGLMDIHNQELQIVQCKGANIRAVLGFAGIEAVPYLKVGLASAKFTMITSTKKENLEQVSVDIKNLDKK